MKEKQNIEWKVSWRDEYIKWICGFANAAGGTLVIGKNNKGIVTGVDNAGRLLEDIPNKVKDILGIIVDVNLKTDKGKEFNAFFRAGLIEAWGRGIYKIMSECETFGTAPPKFNCDFSGLMVEFGAKGEEVSGKTTQKTRVKTRVKTTQKSTQKTTQKILSILKENPSTSRKEIAVILGDITEDGVKYQLNKMKKEKILERIGPAKGGYWKIIKE